MPIQQESALAHSMRSALVQQTTAIRDRRRVVEEKWLRQRRTWMGFPNAHYIPTDTAGDRYEIPAARRVIERAVVRVVKLLTPTVKWFEVAPMSDNDIPQERISNVDSFMWYVMRKKIKSRSNISQLARCMIQYGVTVLKTSITIQNNQVWPTQRAVDPFSFYIYPETSPTLEECEDIFEDFLFSYERYNTFVKRGIVDDIPRSELTAPQWPYHLVERLAYQGITDPTANVDIRINTIGEQLQRTTSAFVSLTEKWIRHEGSLYQVYIAWNLAHGPRIVGFFRSQYDDPLYRMAVHRPLPGETYTTAQAEDISTLDDVQNDVFNQFIDAVDWEQGFVTFGGSEGMRRDTFKMKGRAKWDFGSESPKEVMQLLQPPVTSTNQLRAWQICNAMMQSMGGAGTIAEGQPGRNMPRSGEAVSSLINLGMADIQDIAEVIEQEVLTPSLSDIYKVSSFIPDDQLMRIPGGIAFYNNGDIQSNIIKKRDILGDYEFEWVGSLQFQDEAQRAQRLMIFLNMVPQLMPLLAEQGYVFDLAELIQMIWRSGIGERGLSRVVVTAQEMQQKMMQSGAMPPQQQGMPAQSQQLSVNGTNGANGASTLPPDIQYLLDQVTGGAQAQRNGTRAPAQPRVATPGLQPTLPTVTSGFTRRR